MAILSMHFSMQVSTPFLDQGVDIVGVNMYNTAVIKRNCVDNTDCQVILCQVYNVMGVSYVKILPHHGRCRDDAKILKSKILDLINREVIAIGAALIVLIITQAMLVMCWSPNSRETNI